MARDDLAFVDSGVIEPGESFHATFEESEVHRYHFGPQSDMSGMTQTRRALGPHDTAERDVTPPRLQESPRD